MSLTAYHAIPGSRVYRHCRPMNPGIVQKMIGIKRQTNVGEVEFKGVIVKWLNGTETEEFLTGLKMFDQLIAEHEKKLATHKATAEKLKKLQESL